ncbi:MAG: DnaT-like ssDNA-binding domain-containing protein [Pseudomonadota bacterium]
MSVQAMSWALAQTVVSDASARHVLLCLANYADKDGCGAFPSAASLADDTGLAVRTVRYKLEQLQELGAIRPGNQAIAAAYIDRGDRRPVVYDLAMERGAADAPRAERPATGAPRENVRGANGDSTGCKPQQHGVQSTTARGARVAPNPSLNHQGTTSEPSDARTPFALDLNWTPDAARLRAVSFAAGVSVEACMEALGAFRVHHEAKALVFTSAEWHAKLVTWAKQDAARGAASKVAPIASARQAKPRVVTV